MKITTLYCPQCGAPLDVNNNGKKGVCLYCKTPYVIDQNNQFVNDLKDGVKDLAGSAISAGKNILNNFNANQNFNNNANRLIPPRPKTSVVLAIVLFCVWFWPGVIYLIYMSSKQKKWDYQYANRQFQQNVNNQQNQNVNQSGQPNQRPMGSYQPINNGQNQAQSRRGEVPQGQRGASVRPSNMNVKPPYDDSENN